MDRSEQERLKREASAFILSYFEAGKNKDLTSLMAFHSPPATFTKFDEHPPFTRQDSEEAFIHEQAAFANIADYEYDIKEMRIDLVAGVAIATFYLTYKGVFVNDYSFEGMTVGSRCRVTMVLARFPDGWKMTHEHFSAFPDVSKGEPARAQQRG